MNRHLSPFHPLSWSLWVKFLVGLIAGLILLAIPTYLFVRDGVYGISEQNALSFVTQIGVKQATSVNNALVQARTVLDTFMADENTQQLLIGFLLRDVRTDTQTYLPNISNEQITSIFRAGLLNPAAASFDSVRLLDRNGQALANINVSTANFTPADESQSTAFREIQSAQLQGQPAVLAISQGNIPVVEIVRTLFWRDGTPLGYLVTPLNSARVFFNNLRLEETPTSYSAYAFLATAQGALIAPPAIRERALAASSSPAVEQALAGQTSATAYEANDNASYFGYSTPIGGTPFVLIAQAPAAAVYDSALQFFQLRAFIVGAGVLLVLLLLAFAFTQIITPSANRLRRAAQALADGDFSVPVPDAQRGDEIGLLATSFVNMRDQVRTLVDELENRVAVRTRDINATQEISRYAATQRDLQTLMDRVVELITDRFDNIYHAQIFLIDAEQRDAVLRSSTGEAGRQLLSRGHRLGIGSLSVIGQVTQQGRLIVARDASVSQVHRRNEFLPNTLAELAIPLRVGETVIGALDVQSQIRDAFDEDQIAVLQTMADQIAVAIQNALLYQDSVQRAAEIETNNRESTRQAWEEFIRDQRTDMLTSQAGYTTEEELSDLRRMAAARGEIVVGAVTSRNTVPVAAPVVLRGQVLGAVEWELPAASLSEEKLELAKELANRLALSLDNARLFQESQRATERERLVNSIAAKLTAQTTINDILQTAVREVGQALRAPQVSIQLRGAQRDEFPTNGSHGNGNGAAAD